MPSTDDQPYRVKIARLAGILASRYHHGIENPYPTATEEWFEWEIAYAEEMEAQDDRAA